MLLYIASRLNIAEVSPITFGGSRVAAFLFSPPTLTKDSLIKRKTSKARGDRGLEVFCVKDTGTRWGYNPSQQRTLPALGEERREGPLGFLLGRCVYTKLRTEGVLPFSRCTS